MIDRHEGSPLKVIAFDGDDTLWHNITVFRSVEERFIQLLARYHSAEWIERMMYETEMRNLKHFGYGAKGFTISLIETAIELTEGRITGSEVQQIINSCKDMMAAPVDVIEGVAEVLGELAGYSRMLITKGDLFDQEIKLARSGLGQYFSHVEIVSDKTAEVYATVLAKHGIKPSSFVMVGNSLRSDVLPVLAVGGHAVYVPYHTTWAHEQVADADRLGKDFAAIERISELPQVIAQLAAGARNNV
jgi:putative hydrolase of the HAD superfamily